MNWEALLELARQLAAATPAAVTAPLVQNQAAQAQSNPTAPAVENAIPQCVEPRYSYSSWEQTGEHRWAEGEWIWRTRHYAREVTDNCDGTTTIETKSEGPDQLWQAVPDRRVADVNRPSGSTEALSGVPLRTSDPPAGLTPAVGPKDRPTGDKRKPPEEDKGTAPKGPPFYPSIFMLLGVAVAAWQQKRHGGGGGTPGSMMEPDPDSELLDWKVQHYLALARGGRWDVRNPQFKDDPMFAGYRRDWDDLKPATQDTIRTWQKEWNAVAAYWEDFFSGTGPVGPAPDDPWGVGDIARGQAAHLLRGKLADFRAIVYRLAANPDELDDLSPGIQDLWRSIEHYRSVFPSEEADKLVRETFAGDEVVVGRLVVELKKRQYQELARAGQFDVRHPQFSHDERLRPFALLKPVWAPDTEKQVEAQHDAWVLSAGYWQAKLSGANVGAPPDDVLGVGAAGQALWAELQRRERWAKVDQTMSVLAPKGSTLDQKRFERWAKADQGAELTGSYGGDGWTWPRTPLKLGGPSRAEQFLTKRIEALNSRQIPEAAALYVRNLKIVALKENGTPPTSPVPVPSTDSPEVQAVIRQLTWNQEKVDKVWARASQLGVDPRVMLAVIMQEGTGSFNTNADVPVQFWSKEKGRYVAGGSGLQPIFADDLDDAMEAHILAKLKAYSHYGQAFKAAAEEAGLGDGNVFQYANYPVPWVKESGWTVRPGPYATHTEWWNGVSSAFTSLADDVSATAKYSAYLLAHPFEAPPAPQVKFALTYNGTGHVETITERPWIEATQ